MFLRNAWYVAAWDHEVGRELKPVKILGEEIVLYRKGDGTPAALEDACPHRKLPLSMGRLKGDDVECGYHGLTFDCTGTCTRVPGAEKIPHVARVQSYPIAERYGRLDLLVNAAGFTKPVPHGDLDALDDALIDRMFEVSAGKILALENRWRGADGAPVFTVSGQYQPRGIGVESPRG